VTILELRALATSRAEAIDGAVRRRFGDIHTRTRIFDYKGHLPRAFWDITYTWTMVPTVTEPVAVTFYETSETSDKAVTVWYEPHHVGLQLNELDMDIHAVEKAVIAALEKHECRRIEPARTQLEAAGLAHLTPFLDELQRHREWAQKNEEDAQELRKSFKNDHEYENHVKQSLRAAADRMEKGMHVYHARIKPLTEENPVMMTLDVTLSYPWGG
jgi:hypothetical protein